MTSARVTRDTFTIRLPPFGQQWCSIRSIPLLNNAIVGHFRKQNVHSGGKEYSSPSREHDGNTGYLKSEVVAHSSELLP